MLKYDWSNLPSMKEVDEQENPLAVAHFTMPLLGDWYVVAGEVLDNGEVLFFGLADLDYKELGTFVFSEFVENDIMLDVCWIPKGVYDIYPDFDLRR